MQIEIKYIFFSAITKNATTATTQALQYTDQSLVSLSGEVTLRDEIAHHLVQI